MQLAMGQLPAVCIGILSVEPLATDLLDDLNYTIHNSNHFSGEHCMRALIHLQIYRSLAKICPWAMNFRGFSKGGGGGGGGGDG